MRMHMRMHVHVHICVQVRPLRRPRQGRSSALTVTTRCSAMPEKGGLLPALPAQGLRRVHLNTGHSRATFAPRLRSSTRRERDDITQHRSQR
jgi:hypothetical protein